MPPGSVRRCTGKPAAFTVTMPAALRATPPPSTSPTRHGTFPGLVSMSTPVSAANSAP